MAKNRRREQRPGGKTVPALPAEGPAISVRGKKVIRCGVALIALGFVVLTRVDPRGRNWAGTLSPFLILGGYAVVGLGIYVPDPVLAVPAASPSPASAGPV